MDPATSILTQTTHALGLDSCLSVILALHMLLKALDAAIPQPAAGSHWLPLRKVVSILALNVGYAANADQPSILTWLERVLQGLATLVPPQPVAQPQPAQTQPAQTRQQPVVEPLFPLPPVPTPGQPVQPPQG